MSTLKKFIIWSLAIIFTLTISAYKIPAWLIGSVTSKLTNHRLITTQEYGTFWNGSALLVASDKNNKINIPLQRINWKIKFGIKSFITINMLSYDNEVAMITLQKDGLHIDNINLQIPLDQILAFSENLETLGLFGDVSLTGSALLLWHNKQSGTLHVALDGIGSAMSPLNPIGFYQVTIDLTSKDINVSTNSNSLVSISGSGSFNNHLTLNATVEPAAQESLLQFMTIMGLPQADGSYQMKVF